MRACVCSHVALLRPFNVSSVTFVQATHGPGKDLKGCWFAFSPKTQICSSRRGQQKNQKCKEWGEEWACCVPNFSTCKWGILSDSPKLEKAPPSKDNMSWCGPTVISSLGQDSSKNTLHVFPLSLSLSVDIGTLLNVLTRKRQDCSPTNS